MPRYNATQNKATGAAGGSGTSKKNNSRKTVGGKAEWMYLPPLLDSDDECGIPVTGPPPTDFGSATTGEPTALRVNSSAVVVNSND